jgi:hypothetical protein
MGSLLGGGGDSAGSFEACHEPADALLGAVARLATHPQIEHESRVLNGQSAEFGGWHFVLPEEFFDGSDQHAKAPGRLV